MTNYRYQFKTESTMDKLIHLGSSKICNISNDFSLKQDALFYGKLRRLFGEPIYETKNLEEKYAYCITTTAEDGKEIVLEVYSGSSGPAIGGLQDQESKTAANQLKETIQKAAPADYDYIGFYYDGPSKVHMGVKNGVPFGEEEELEWEELEWDDEE